MPLIIISGTPVSGKTYRANELKTFFKEQHQKKVILVSEDDAIRKLGYAKNTIYLDSKQEKILREHLKSEVIRLIEPDNVVILDGSNYIKGYRYELYCASKCYKCTQCTIYTMRNHNDAWAANQQRLNQQKKHPSDAGETENQEEKHERLDIDNLHKSVDEVAYTKEVFDALTKFRFEEPNGNNRWDSPLFSVHPHDKLDLDAVYKVLFERAPPPPNMSTQNAPPSAANFIHDLDKVTQNVCQSIMNAKQLNVEGELKLPGYENCVLDSHFLEFVNPNKLHRLRRQFLVFAKMQYPTENPAKIGGYFVQYLNRTVEDVQ